LAGDFRDPMDGLVTARLIGFMWRAFPRVTSWAPWINWILKWASWAVFVGVVATVHPVLRVALLTLSLWLFDRFGEPALRGRYRALVLAGILYSLWWTVFYQLPVPYRWLTDFSLGYSHILTQVMSVPLILGPSAAAMDILLLGICALLAVTLVAQPRRWANFILWAVVLEAAHVIYLWTAPKLLGIINTAIPVSTTPHMDLPAVFFLFVALVVWVESRNSADPLMSRVKRSAAFDYSRTGYASLALIVLTCIVAGAASYGNRPLRVMMLQRNILDDGVPQHGNYGDRSGGMFGFLPKYLDNIGYTTIRRAITREVLDSVDVIFVANLLEKIPEDERNLVWEFVERGGGLLVVGDHTGTDAIREPTNDLLSPCGLELNFDTAVPMRRSWASAKSFLFHPLGRSGGVMDAELWLGASVKAGPKGEPFVVGRGAFSDPGDMNNKARSYLGNLAYDPGEPLGDVVLAAAAHWGKGKAVLHGDTSPYQNGTIIRSHSMINRTLRWMTDDSWLSFIDRWRSELLLVLIGIIGTVLVILSFSQPVWMLTALLLPALSVGVFAMIPGDQASEWSGKGYRQVLIDEGHGQMFDLMAWEPKSIGGLQYNLMRNGFSPRFVDSPTDLKKEDADLYIIFSPSQPYEPDEIGQLVEFAENGGWILSAAGWNTYPMVEKLYERFGVRLENIPLGASDGTAFNGVVKMADAYPVVGDGDGIQTLIESFGKPVAKVVTRGKGGLIAIGDSQFLYCKNLEGQNEQVVMENVQFFRELMDATFITKTQ
jgi:hypothetical protein